MANKKKLQKAAIKFRNENPRLYRVYSALISRMAKFITASGATEVTVGFKDEVLYAHANNKH